jgi:hypothetical protein
MEREISLQDREDEDQDLTTTGVEGASKLGRMTGTRALTERQVAWIRARFRQLIDKVGSQTQLGRDMGLSQQVVGRILNGDPAGLYVARKLAKYDKVPVETVLDCLPPILEKMIRENRGRWSEPTLACVRKIAGSMNADLAASRDWESILDEFDKALVPLVRQALSKK